ncbi:MAG: acyl-CoA desaturase [Phycisphaeraceae bacterium]
MSTAASSSTSTLPKPRTVRARILWVYAIPIAALHVLVLAAVVPWLFSWTGLIAMIVGVHVFGQGINIGYHRLLAHRSFQTPRWVERAFVLLALCCMQDTPARWVANHRFHHKYSDTEPDPHSPLVSFLWSHVGWLMFYNAETHNIAAYQKYVPDLVRDPFYFKLEKRPWILFWVYVAHAMLFFAAGAVIGYVTTASWMAALQFGLSLLVWGVIVRTVAVWHITWSVNSLTHLLGYRNYETGEHSTNNWLVALLTVGEGWHNNHHHDPASASNQHRWWEFDISYYEIKLLEWLGLANNVLPPRPKRRERGAAS